MRKRFSFIFSIFLLFSTISCAESHPDAFFDKLIDDALKQSGVQNTEIFQLEVIQKENARYYNYNYPFKKQNNKQHYLLLIAVSHAEPHAITDDSKVSDKAESEKDTTLKNIGKLARKLPEFFGPAGSSFGLEFVTTDGEYLIRLLVSMLMPTDIEAPDFSLIAIASNISQTYDKSTSIKK